MVKSSDVFQVKRANPTTGVDLREPPLFLRFQGHYLQIAGGRVASPVSINLARFPNVTFKKGLLGASALIWLQEYGEPLICFRCSNGMLDKIQETYGAIASACTDESANKTPDSFGRHLLVGETIQKRLGVNANIWSGTLPGLTLTLTNQRVILFGRSASRLLTVKSAALVVVGLLLGSLVFLPALVALDDPRGDGIFPDWLVAISIFAFVIWMFVVAVLSLLGLVKAAKDVTALFTATIYAADLNEIQGVAAQSDARGQHYLAISLQGNRYITCSLTGRREKQEAAAHEWLNAIRLAVRQLGMPLKTSDHSFQVCADPRIQVVCTKCGHRSTTARANAGKKAKCPTCGNVLAIPGQGC